MGVQGEGQCQTVVLTNFKDRLVAKGYEQKIGVNYILIFSPVAIYDTTCTVFSVFNVIAHENLCVK